LPAGPLIPPYKPTRNGKYYYPEVKVMRRSRTGMVVTGLGVAATAVGRMVGGSVGAGITGFGVANIVLGMLDGLRPSVR
jgi:hypothetical protein